MNVYAATVTTQFTIGRKKIAVGTLVSVGATPDKKNSYTVTIPGLIAPVQFVEATVKRLITMNRSTDGKMIPLVPKGEAVKTPEPTTEPVQKVNTSQPSIVQPGYYTIVFPAGDHITVRVRCVEEGNFAGKTIVAYLSGSDNESSYTGCGFLFGTSFKLWKKFEGNERLNEALTTLLDPSEAERAGFAFALKSNRCSRCGRRLTVPASIYRGRGPSCVKMD